MYLFYSGDLISLKPYINYIIVKLIQLFITELIRLEERNAIGLTDEKWDYG
jgi:hypothetical protein